MKTKAERRQAYFNKWKPEAVRRRRRQDNIMLGIVIAVWSIAFALSALCKVWGIWCN